ncbi:uncharacterized protein EV420DRAFT_1202843 [Desarmillaria tabescens]|uniref:Uncharacterized protein n=1 Tax=Armillaria tabescens TaxID=1929756 RepID=A0AA39JBQ4_ARMTA|nr:uncharacterized protein EV420DRAFT_1202843 [Desarmillaria tabescens]KAK0439077.1 hypothetical protein EV420DRAFT_1202843 [Desarmillaria tabescens]
MPALSLDLALQVCISSPAPRPLTLPACLVPLLLPRTFMLAVVSPYTDQDPGVVLSLRSPSPILSTKSAALSSCLPSNISQHLFIRDASFPSTLPLQLSISSSYSPSPDPPLRTLFLLFSRVPPCSHSLLPFLLRAPPSTRVSIPHRLTLRDTQHPRSPRSAPSRHACPPTSRKIILYSIPPTLPSHINDIDGFLGGRHFDTASSLYLLFMDGILIVYECPRYGQQNTGDGIILYIVLDCIASSPSRQST